MERDDSQRITELLCSHLCHELISPVTAINNGLELIGSGDPSLEPEAVELTRHSAAEASRRWMIINCYVIRAWSPSR